MKPHIREALKGDQEAVLDIVKAAFGSQEGPEIAGLITDLLADPTAQPLLSLVATVKDEIIGHILFTNAPIEGSERNVSSSILAPLAVHPEHQGQGVGRQLIEDGLSRLKAARVDLVFVLGYPAYYTKHGFAPAGARGFKAPYSILPKNADAWMVQELRPGLIGNVRGQVNCADALDDPKYWRE